MTADDGGGAARRHSAGTGEEGGLPPGRRQVAALAVFASVAMSSLLNSIVNLALPVMADELGAAPADIVWVITAYLLALLVAMLPSAALGEIFGYRRVFLLGLAGVTVASAVCALAESLPLLIAARVFQGVASAAVMSVNGALLRHVFPPAYLGRAIGMNAMTVALGGTLGPGVGALILSVASWHWIFWLTVPMALFSAVLAYVALPRVAGVKRRFDAIGAVLNVAAFGLLFIGADQLVKSPLLGLLLVAAGALAMYRLVLHQRGRPQPLLPLDLLALPNMGIVLGASVAGFAAQMLCLVALPFLMRDAWGMGPAESGALLLLWPLSVGAMAPVAGRLADRVDTAVLCAAGSGLLGVALLVLAGVPGGSSAWLAGAAIAFCGISFGLFQTPNSRAILLGAPIARSGGAGGMQAAARQVGQGGGTVIASAMFQLVPAGAATASLWVGAAIAALAAALSLLRWRRGAS
jgi:DHA2 family multidrug resistance protein-like MFS transporter